jgi:nicotinamide mononucleotide adenylyltransferase
LGVELTPKEKLYLAKWVQTIKEKASLYNLRDTMLPERESRLTLNDIDAKNYYALNSIPKVQFDRDVHGSFSLNDLVMELSHFLDEEVVNKVETELYSDRLRREWGLSKDFKVVETRNKEISIVLNELEEVAFRSAG